MAEETANAASSAAGEATQFTQFTGWDEEGNPVVHKKAETPKAAGAAKPDDAESAAADASEETKSDDEADSAAKKTQEKTPADKKEWKDAKRWKEVTERVKQLERELEEARKPKETKTAESSTAKAAEQKPAEPAPTRPKPARTDKGTDGKPKYPTEDDYQEAVTDWKVEQQLAKRDREQQEAQQTQAVKERIGEAKQRYADFDAVTKPLIQDLMKPDVPREVFAVLNDSPVLADLLYAIGGAEATKAEFLEACRTNPGKALRVALLMEQEIKAELARGKPAAKKEGEGEGEKTPAKPTPRAPKPPTEVGGRGTPGEDPRVSAAKSGKFRQFEEEETRRVLASRR